MNDDDFVFAWRAHQRELQQDRRMFFAVLKAIAVTAIGMLGLFTLALFGV